MAFSSAICAVCGQQVAIEDGVPVTLCACHPVCDACGRRFLAWHPGLSAFVRNASWKRWTRGTPGSSCARLAGSRSRSL